MTIVLVLGPSSQDTQESQRCSHRSPSLHCWVHLQPVVETSRERPEAVLGLVVSSYRSVQVVGVVLGPRLVGHLGAETRPRCEDGVEHARGEALIEV